MSINLHLPSAPETLRPTITVIGVGGAGGNAVNNMIASNLEGVNFIVANTDAQALEHSLTERRIQLGMNSTQGLGAGAHPSVGCTAAEESIDELISNIEGSNMLFITAGMGGGTGTGAAPVVARAAREMGILTVGVVTKPFGFEGAKRMRQADSGLEELQKHVDTMIVIPNQNLFRMANEKTTLNDAFRMADEVLHSGVRGVTDLMIMPGLINLDFADIRTVMKEMGKAMMGTGEASGEGRAIAAAEAAISNPLLDDVSMKGAKGVLINITGGHDMTLFEVDEAANRVREEVDPEANIIFGSTFNPSLEGTIRVSVVATGIDYVQPQAAATTSTAATAPAQPTAAPLNKPVPSASPAANRFAPRPAEANEVRSAVDASRSKNVVDFAALSKMRAAANASKVEAPQAAEEKAEASEPAKAEPAPAAPAVAQIHTETPAFEEEEAPAVAAISPREASSSPRAAETAAPAAGVGFFQRFGLGRGTQAEDYEDDEVMVEEEEDYRMARKTEVKSASGSAEEEQEYLDIPAFLRRQAK